MMGSQFDRFFYVLARCDLVFYFKNRPLFVPHAGWHIYEKFCYFYANRSSDSWENLPG